jgi:hypothetical protein
MSYFCPQAAQAEPPLPYKAMISPITLFRVSPPPLGRAGDFTLFIRQATFSRRGAINAQKLNCSMQFPPGLKMQ